MATTIQQIELPKKARAVDTSGNNNHGQIYSGRGLEFDGVSDHLLTGYGNGLNPYTTPITVATWVKTAAADGKIFIGPTAGTNQRFYIGHTGGVWDMGIQGSIWNSTTNEVSGFSDQPSYELDTWYRIVVVMSAGQATMYVNGVKSYAKTYTSYVFNSDITIGSFGDNTSYYWDGMMSDVQIWDAAFTQADATYDYLNPESLALNNGGTALTESNLKLWYPMQDGHRGQQSYILDGANSGLGVELANFADGNITFNNSGASVASSNSLNSYNAVGDGSTGDSRPRVSFALTTGQTYKIEYTPTLVLDGGVLDFFVGGSRLIANNDINTSFTKTFTSAAGHEGFDFDGSQAFNVDFTLSIKAINDKNHATTVFYGDELVTNGDFADNTPSDTWDGSAKANLSGTWTALGTHTSANHFNIVGGECRIRHDGGTATGIGNSTLLTIGRTYTVSFEIISVASGSIKVYIGSGTTNYSTTGVKTVTAVADSQLFAIYRNSACDLIFDDVTVKETGVASGWTDADQQLHIPQTALQSYNELAWFDGTSTSNGYVALDSQIATTNNNWSLSFWMFRLDTGASYSFIFGQNDNEKIIAIDNNGDEKLNYRATGGVYHDLSNAALPHGEWIHVVITAIADTSMTAYINGVAQTTNSDMSDTELVLDWFMRGYQNANYNVLGSVNEISYYSDVLTATEALDLYNDGKAKSALEASGSAGLVGYWRNNGLSEWKDLKGSNDGNTTAGVVETILIPQGVDSTRDAQGFIMNKQKDTSSLNFTNGSDSPHVDLGSITTIADDEAFSFVVWLKPDDLAANNFIGRGSSLDWVRIHDSNTIKFRADNTTVVFSTSTLVAKEWVHVAIVRKASNDLVSVYINGAAGVDTETLNEPFDYRYLGSGDTANDNFRGAIDGFLIYEDELSAAEVLRNYNATKGSHRN